MVLTKIKLIYISFPILKNYVFFPETSEDRESNKNIIKELQRIIQQEIDKRTDFFKNQ